MPGVRSDRVAIRVTAPARLHLGFLDLEGGLGRRFGSLGLAIEGLATEVELAGSETDRIGGGAEGGRVADILARLRRAADFPPANVTIGRAIPAHVGLGSGTQLGLALGVGLARVGGLDLDAGDIAPMLGRGARSGIGIGAFRAGGFLLDGGSAGDGAPPPVTARLDFPSAWRVLLILDRSGAGLHGTRELEAFRGLPAFPAGLAGHLCRLVVMRLLPGLATADLDAVGAAIGELQRHVGDHFAPAQGARFTSPAVSEVLDWLAAQGVAGVGQSSWGPTGFALLPDEAAASGLQAAAARRFTDAHPGLELIVTRGRNRGADFGVLG